MRAGIIDYGAGNLRSAANAVASLGIEPRILSSPEELDGLTHLILPGVGAFGDSMSELCKRGLDTSIKDWIAADRPFFGICVGYQLLFDGGEESPSVEGLGVIEGQVIKFPKSVRKIPHMGWNAAELTQPGDPIWAGLGDKPYFYFVHSFFPQPDDPSIVAGFTEYEGVRFPCVIKRGRMIATQFHPEKSQQAGLRLLENFLKS